MARKKTPISKLASPVSISIPKDIKTAAARMACEQGKSLSQFVKELLMANLKNA